MDTYIFCLLYLACSPLIALGPFTDANWNESSVLRDELETTMKMCGVTSLDELHPGLLNTLRVDSLVPETDHHPYAKWRRKKLVNNKSKL